MIILEKITDNPAEEIYAYNIDDELTADNVLKYQLGLLKEVSLVGRDKSGEWVYASSEGPGDILYALAKFKKLIKKGYIRNE